MAQGRLTGKVGIVTGAASRGPGVGTGKATAILFAREGAKVFLVNRSESHAQELQREIEREGGECSIYAGDVTKAADVEKMVEAAVQRYGKLDILVNNVGIGGGRHRGECHRGGLGHLHERQPQEHDVV